MASHNEVGKEGEELAAEWLVSNGFEILQRNWRYSHYEIDIVARKNNTLHIVEVKAWRFTPFGHPEQSVTKKKFKNLQRATDEYLFRNPPCRWLQYDILAITFFNNKGPEFFLLEDVFL